MRFLNQQAFRRAASLMVALLLLFQSAGAVAPGPGWWTQQEVLDPQAQPDDFAAANLGQLKFMTVRASSALDQWEAASARPLSTAQQGAKAAIHGMIATWNTAPAPNVQRDDFRALNAGQLKQVASLFYDRLGLPHPWPAVSADDHPMVNVGQLKQMFSFELRVMRGSPAMPIPSAVLQPAYAAWQALASAQAAPAGSTPEDFDGDGISNWQEYQMHPELPLFDSADKDGDRILDSVETASGGILSPLIFADAVADHDGDGVMNYEEVLLGLNLANLSSGRADGLNDAEVLAWGLLAGVPLAPSTNAVRACWEAIDEAWIEQQGGMAFYGHWLNRTLVNNEPAGWTAFQAEFWGPSNPDAWFIQNPPAPIDLDGDDIPDMDRDGDSLPDLWEYRYQLDPRNEDDDSEDPDGDTLNNLVEFASGTNPRLADTDGDGFTDAEELAHQSDPRQGSSLPPVVLQLTGKAAHQHYPGEITPPLAVRATQAGIARMGIEVTFTRLTGAGMLSPASQAGAGAASSLTVTTGADGLAAITYTAAGEPEKAIIRATAPGVTANIAFTIGVIAVPDDFAGAGGGGGQVGGSVGGEVGGVASILPMASRLLEALFAGSDGMFLRHAFKLDKEKQFSPDDGWLYLGAGQPFYGVSSGGYGTIDLADPTKGVSHHRRIVFESAIRPCSRTYLVLFFQDERVNPGLEYLMSLEPKLAMKTGTLTFSAQDQKTRTITIEGSIPPEYMKKAADANGNPAVDFLGPPPSKEGDRFWMALLPVEVAPEVLASNGDFDEGDKRSIQAQPEGAKADNSNHSMIALSGSVDGRVKVGDLITEDLHPGWFGLKPGILPDDFFNGAEVTIRKVSKQDPETDAPESGRVRMFATWGDKLEREIIPDNQNLSGSSANSSEPKNLVGVVYGTSKTVPAGANFWMEGVTPGKITLEFRIKKGTTDVKHEQTFEIYNKWTRDQWLAVVRDEIYLDSFTSAGGGAKNGISSPGSDISKYTVANDFLPNRPHIYSVYEYYAKLQEQNSNYYWTGLAKLAGGPVYAGMSDCQNGRDGIAIGSVGLFSASLLKSIQDVLIDANINIYNDLAYQFVAYRVGGIKSIKHLNQRGEVTLPLYDAWKQIADGSDVTGASQILLQREQRDILLKTYADLDSLGYGSISWLFSVLCESPILGDPDFRSVVPSGSLSNYNNRWLWITDSMWPSWTSKNSSERKALAAFSLRSHASNYVWIPILR